MRATFLSSAATVLSLAHHVAFATSPAAATTVKPNTSFDDIPQPILQNVYEALSFERSNHANDRVEEDPFYRVPATASRAKPGTLLKNHVRLPEFERLGRTSVRLRALALSPREVDYGYPVVAFAHGNSGSLGDCAPSHLRSLWYHFEVPFELALQGYVVVAPDYQGLGVNKDQHGEPVYHNFLANPAEADDLFYATQAAQKAFPKLSRKFVTMGHSQGGGAAWAAAHRQAENPVKGYLGTIPISAVTKFLEESPGVLHNSSSGTAILVAHGLGKVFPNFEPRSMLTPKGMKRLDFLRQIQGCNAVVSQLFPDIGDLVHDNWATNKYILAYQNLTQNGNRPIAGPMLIMQGTADPAVPESVTTSVVDTMCRKKLGSSVNYVRFEGVGHTPTCYASRRIWLDWIAARFAGESLTPGCHKDLIGSALPYKNYQFETNFVLKYATLKYELA